LTKNLNLQYSGLGRPPVCPTDRAASDH